MNEKDFMQHFRDPLQSFLQRTTGPQALMDSLTQKRPSILTQNMIEEVMPYNMPDLLQRIATRPILFRDRIESIAPLAAALRVRGAASDRLEAFRAALPNADFTAYINAMATPGQSLQDKVELTAKLFEGAGLSAAAASGEATLDVQAAFALGDDVTATVRRPPELSSDASWWQRLSHADRVAYLGLFISILGVLLALQAAISSQADSERDAEFQKQLLAATQAIQADLAESHKLDRQRAVRNAEEQREFDSLRRKAAMLLDPMVTRQCEVTAAATSVRQLGPRGRVTQQLSRGDLVLCVASQGKWVEVAFDDLDGQRLHGWVRKKHLTWDGKK